MKVLLSYLKEHKWIVALALLLAAFNIGFSLCDPLITRNIVDHYMVPVDHKIYSFDDKVHGVLKWIGLAIGAAMVSRIAKNFQDYFTNIITQNTYTSIKRYLMLSVVWNFSKNGPKAN